MPHAVRFHETGGPAVLRWEEVALPPPAPGEVRVRHRAIGLNYIDVYHRTGLYPVASLPSGVGLEAAGEVVDVGPGVTDFERGARVAYATVPLGPVGAYAEERNVPAAKLVRIPDGLDEKTVAAALLKGMTVQYLVTRCFRVEAGMTVLLHAAAGGVGTLAAQWLRALGCVVIGTVGSAEKAELARRSGCDHVLVTRGQDVAVQVRELTDGRGVPVVYDGVGRATWDASLDSLARRGTLVSYGNASGPVPAFEPRILSEKGSLYLTRPTLFDYTTTRGELESTAAELFEVLADGRVTVEIARTHPLSDAAAAHAAIESRETVGQTVLLPG